PVIAVNQMTLLSAPSILQTGSGVPNVVNGFGHNMPLGMAVSAIVPQGWRVYDSGPALPWACPVSWPTHQTWIRALGRVMDQSGAQAHVYWPRRIVVVTRQSALMSTSPCLSLLAARRAKQLAAQRAAGGVTPLVHMAALARWWSVRKGATVRATLAQWVKTNKSLLIWRSPVDWPIEAGSRYHGTFVQAIGWLAQALSAQDVPIRLRRYPNHVLVVRDVDVSRRHRMLTQENH
ncbi:MAG: TcpQ domain-containing protein, partial [Thermoplasmataceae archaeon]